MRILFTLILAIMFSPVSVRADTAWNGAEAMKDIATQVSFGPRSMDEPGHQKVIAYIKQQLAKTPAKIEEQNWSYTALDGKTHAMTNIIAHFDPANPRHILLGTHYDSIIRAYRDKKDPKAYMPGANNSASGVALLLETARVLKDETQLPVGVDIIFFDGEEGPQSMGEGDPHWMPLGSWHFGEQIHEIYPGKKPEQGAIFDMVCYRDLQLKLELYSLRVARPQVENFWKTGMQIAPSIFTPEKTAAPVADDQIALSKAGIPTFLVIGFDYDPWYNTTEDTPDKCAAPVLEGLGKTLLAYLHSL